MKVEVAQSCLTLCDPMDYTDHGIPQARIAVPISRGSSHPGTEPRFPALQTDSLPSKLQGKPVCVCVCVCVCVYENPSNCVSFILYYYKLCKFRLCARIPWYQSHVRAGFSVDDRWAACISGDVSSDSSLHLATHISENTRQQTISTTQASALLQLSTKRFRVNWLWVWE